MVFRAVRTGARQAGYSLLIIPLLVHLNLEYPFYQSFVHLGLLVVLLQLAQCDAPSSAEPKIVPVWGMLSRLVSLLVSVVLICFSAAGLYANAELTRLERQKLTQFPEPSPWYFKAQSQRAEFDAIVALLVNYNMTRNEQDLALFMTKAEPWLNTHMDKNLLTSMIIISRYRGNIAEVQRLQKILNVLT